MPMLTCIFSPVMFRSGWPAWRSIYALDAKARCAETLWLAWQLPQTGGCLWRKSGTRKDRRLERGDSACLPGVANCISARSETDCASSFAPTANGAVYRVWSEDTLCRKDPRKTIEVRTQLYRDLVKVAARARANLTDGASRTRGTRVF